MNNVIGTRRWRWIGHVVRKKDDSISRKTEDSRKRTGTTKFKLGSSCRQDEVEEPCYVYYVAAPLAVTMNGACDH